MSESECVRMAVDGDGYSVKSVRRPRRSERRRRIEVLPRRERGREENSRGHKSRAPSAGRGNATSDNKGGGGKSGEH